MRGIPAAASAAFLGEEKAASPEPSFSQTVTTFILFASKSDV